MQGPETGSLLGRPLASRGATLDPRKRPATDSTAFKGGTEGTDKDL